MISGLNRQGSDDPPKRLQLDPSVIPAKEIPDFVTSKTLTFFDILGLDGNFIRHTDPDSWQSLEEFRIAKQCVDSLTVVNDRAERAVKLMSDYNSSITTNEEPACGR